VHLLLRPAHEPWRLTEIADSAQIFVADLQNEDAVSRIVATVKPEWVFHLAAYGAYPNQAGIRQMVATNVLGSAALLEASIRAGVQTFIQTGSSSEYGYKDHAAVEEERLEPNSHYAITKATATHYCQFTAKTRDFNAVSVRLYSIYGPYESPGRLIPTLIMHGLRGIFPPLVSPRIVRDFVYVDDAVSAMLQIAASPSIPRGSVYNICSGIQTSLEEVVEIARKLMNIPGQPGWSSMEARSWDTEHWVGSPVRTAREVGWRATIDLEAGMQQTVEWLKVHPELLRLYSERIFHDASADRRQIGPRFMAR
jgi:dolichol-phosphate mannosyltransferase